MTEQLYTLFRNCYPGIIRTPSHVKSLFSDPDNRILVRCEGQTLTAAAVLYQNHLVMLCVHPDFRGRGIGSALLAECEDSIRAQGYDTVKLTPGKTYLTPGAPMAFAPYENNRAFLEKRGYVHTWGEDECVDMMLDMASLDDLGVHIGDTIPGKSKREVLDPDAPENRMTYRFAAPADIEKTVECVAEAEEDFVKYYRNPAPYEAKGCDRVLIAENGLGFVCGALLVTAGGEAEGLGSVGCTSTRALYQGRGIATNMIKAGTMYLKEQGMTRGYLGYTYTDIIPMYARAGYAVSMKYFMGEKKL